MESTKKEREASAITIFLQWTNQWPVRVFYSLGVEDRDQTLILFWKVPGKLRWEDEGRTLSVSIICQSTKEQLFVEMANFFEPLAIDSATALEISSRKTSGALAVDLPDRRARKMDGTEFWKPGRRSSSRSAFLDKSTREGGPRSQRHWRKGEQKFQN